MCISVANFYMKIINNKHTLLYNLPAIHSIQRYNGLCELTNCYNHLDNKKRSEHISYNQDHDAMSEVLQL